MFFIFFEIVAIIHIFRETQKDIAFFPKTSWASPNFPHIVVFGVHCSMALAASAKKRLRKTKNFEE